MVVYSWGRGDFGQLGLGDESDRSFPSLVQSLADKDILHVAAGDFHTAFLTGDGELYTTGNNECGQLGAKSRELQLLPIRVAALDTYTISHVACGQKHTVAVTDTGALASWGAAEFGQVGHKEAAGSVDSVQPRIVKGTRELQFVRVACGAAHTVALTGSGDVYTFGQGAFGALGHGSKDDIDSPKLVETLWGLGIVQVACGENHSAALSADGQVFTWGRGKYGQLGHGTVESEFHPVAVTALSDQMIVQVVCGGDHTMALNSEGELFAWGRNLWGQTGTGPEEDTHRPAQVKFLESERIVQVSAGARHSVALTDNGNIFGWGDGEQGQLGEIKSSKERFPILLSGPENAGKLLYVVAGGEHTLAVYEHPLSQGQRFSDHTPESFSSTPTEASSKSDILGCEPRNPFVEEELTQFLQKHSIDLDRSDGLNVHGEGLRRLKLLPIMQILEGLKGAGTSPREVLHLTQAMEHIFASVKFLIFTFKQCHEEEVCTKGKGGGGGTEGPGLDTGLIRDAYQGILELYNAEVVKRIGAAIMRLLDTMEKHMDRVPESRWLRVIPIILQSPLIGEKQLHVWGGKGKIPVQVISPLKVLSLLHDANVMENLIPYSDFYSYAISESINFQEQYVKWLEYDFPKSKPLISYCQVPYVLTPDAKSKILQAEANIQKQHYVQTSVLDQLFKNQFSIPFLVLTVRRSELIRDTLQQLASYNVQELKKPLKVVFDGEAGIDEGGVTKEFFQLLVRDLFNVGIVLGLAIHNGVILDVHFPLFTLKRLPQTVYKKVMGKEMQLDDLKDVQPQLFRGLQQLLDFDGDVEGTFCLTFQVEYEFFGEIKTHDLIPGGSNIPVTKDNRKRYVDLYVHYLLEESIDKQFSSFKEGFMQVCLGRALSLFRYEELELLICGLPHFDFDVRAMPLEEKKQLLFFSTGNDRAPIGGLACLKFIIQKNGDDTNRLPTAQTCFNILLLPEYSGKAKLENRLKVAIQNSTGFGLQ
ncbi:hypothetical protein AXG93_4485s1040 [Marchantia polymorpha subsp. ruderalis]|uniref:HECT domain-containing protein n=1 Tax=Marchantia polymorpha subsp. ruderalis TaxID=1480154 RepID=A0A176WFM0_MARPO|nr:hypothetical protein AXG93_4485s1040 [Marchantia polymorpha subsp. ruderalis]